MDLNDAIFSRRSIREYSSEAVDDETVDRLIRAAVQAPSAINSQSWIFTVIRMPKILDDISRLGKAHMLANASAHDAEHFRELLADPNFHIFYHAPVLILISAKVAGPWVVENCTLAAENLMLCACGLGLGTCWIGFAQNFLNTPEGKRLLGLPEESVPVAPIIVGHPKSIPFDVPRKSPEIRWIR
jgi:nitroreductase